MTTPSSSETDTHGLAAEELRILSAKCLEAREKAYCPYSSFRVGCAILLHPKPNDPSSTSPTIITGANIENAAYPVGTCAERVAMGTALHAGFFRQRGDVRAVGVATDLGPGEFASPCGMCRQFLNEFLLPTTPVFMHDRTGAYRVRTMGELLPWGFGPDTLPVPERLREGRGVEGGR